MLAFAVIVLIVGAVLARAASTWQFALGTLFLLVAGFVQAVHVGVPVTRALLCAMTLFLCGQVGYVLGMGVIALVNARTKQSAEEQKTGNGVGKEREPIIR